MRPMRKTSVSELVEGKSLPKLIMSLPDFWMLVLVTVGRTV